MTRVETDKWSFFQSMRERIGVQLLRYIRLFLLYAATALTCVLLFEKNIVDLLQSVANSMNHQTQSDFTNGGLDQENLVNNQDNWEYLHKLPLAFQAYHRRDWSMAEQLFRELLTASPDPGLISFNLAALAMQRNNYEDAEKYYRQCLGDSAIAPERFIAASYNLGTVLIQKCQGKDRQTLFESILLYQEALTRLKKQKEPMGIGPDEETIRNNLELAKLLWSAINQQEPKRENPNNTENNPDSEGKNNSDKENTNPEKSKGKNKSSSPKESIGAKEKNGKGELQNTPAVKKRPGAGVLPVLLDQSEVRPMTPEETRASLQEIAKRLRRERLESRKQAENLNAFPD